jgi:putative Mn2+ efflux pump MntP
MGKVILKKPWQHGAAALVSFGIAYFFISLAIDSGSYWHHIGAIIFIYLGIKCIRHMFKRHGKKD